ncbi:MAG: hypothetical protein IID05_11415 [Gemmatimonadetes bacterium]|nr:hypothetical protein [Gemmatimonadota bacterium]
MLYFRSEADVDAWCERRSIPRGAVVGMDQCWELARRWYDGRLSSDWRGRSPEAAQAIFREVGLTDAFWRL